MVKAKIISFSKPVDNFTTFFLDNGIALLASSILKDGHQVTIQDYGTLEMCDYFKLEEPLRSKIKYISSEMLNLSRTGNDINKNQQNIINESVNNLKKYQKEKIDELASACAQQAFDDNLDVILVKVWNGLGTYFFKKLSLEIKHFEKKERKKIYIYGGGPQVGWFNKHLLKFVPEADGLIFGEGEYSVRELLHAIDKKKEVNTIPGLIHKNNGKIHFNPQNWIDELSVLPYANYDKSIYKSNQNNQKIKFICIDPSRGCPNKCFFCNHHHESGDYWRSKKPEIVVDEIKHYITTYGVRYFKYSGSSTPPDLRARIAEELIRQKIQIRYITFINTNTVTEKDIFLLKESGCFAIFFGIESGNEKILNRSIGTKNSLQNIRKAVTLAKNAGIYTVGSLIIPAPHDTDETIKETIDFMMDVGVDSSPILPPLLTGTETEWSQNSEKYGIAKEKDWIEKMLLWDINLNIPSTFWEPLPYTVNGLKFAEFSNITNKISNIFLRNKIPQISDEMALMARLYGQNENDFVFDTNIELRENNTNKLAERIKAINQRIVCEEDSLL